MQHNPFIPLDSGHVVCGNRYSGSYNDLHVTTWLVQCYRTNARSTLTFFLRIKFQRRGLLNSLRCLAIRGRYWVYFFRSSIFFVVANCSVKNHKKLKTENQARTTKIAQKVCSALSQCVVCVCVCGYGSDRLWYMCCGRTNIPNAGGNGQVCLPGLITPAVKNHQAKLLQHPLAYHAFAMATLFLFPMASCD